ncbi:MAG: hypothetical protein GX612_09425 [Bacteroidales bacterium]|nr:hypothetical protein [Bacteroidales bacterium]
MKTYTGKKTKLSYIPPFIELTEIVVEKGFAESIELNSVATKYDGIENLYFDEES